MSYWKIKLKKIVKSFIGFIQNLEKAVVVVDQSKTLVVGQSVQGKEIRCYRFGQGETKIIFIGCMHGNEVGTVKLTNHIVNFFKEQEDCYRKLGLYVIPCLNPDGYELAQKTPDYLGGGRVGRFNANKVDLNRNFPTSDWQKQSIWSYGKDYSEKQEVFCGSGAGSEPETQALIEFVKNQGIKILFSFHNAGRDVMGNQNETSQRLVELYSRKTGFHLVTDDDWQKMSQTGTVKKWCEENSIAYIEVEGSNRWGSDWQKQREAIIACLNLLNNN